MSESYRKRIPEPGEEIFSTPGTKRGYLLILPLVFYVIVSLTLGFEKKPLTDQWYYFIMARAILEGSLPYKDFFFASGPLFLYPLSFAYTLLGVSLIASKILLVLTGMATIVLTFLLGEKMRKGAGIYAALFLTLSEVFISTTLDYNGVSLAILLSLAAIYVYLKKKPFLSGLLCSFAILVRLNTLLVIAALFLNSLREKKAKEFVKGLLPSFPVLLLPNFVNDAIMYHLEKVPLPGLKSDIFGFFLNYNPILILGALGLAYAVWARKFDWKVSVVSTSAVILMLNGIYFLTTNVFLYHYSAFIAPFLSLFSGYLIAEIRTGTELQKIVLYAVTVSILILGFSPTAGVYASDDYRGYEMYPDMADIMSESGENQTLINFMFYNPTGRTAAYLSFLTGRIIPPNYIDSSLQRIGFSVDEEDFEAAIRESDFVLWELKNRHNYELENFQEILYYIKDEMYPVYLNFIEGDVFIISGKEVPASPEFNFNPLLEGETRDYEITYLKDEQYERVTVRRHGNNSLASLRTDSAFAPFHTEGTVKLVARNHPMLIPPLRIPNRWRTNDSGLVSDSFVLQVENKSVRIITITFDEKTNEHVSLIVLDFDTELRTWSRLDTYYHVKKSEDISAYVSVYSERLIGANVIKTGN